MEKIIFSLFKMLIFLYIWPPVGLRCPRLQYNLLRLGYAFQALYVFPKFFQPRRFQLLDRDYVGSCMLTESVYKMTCGIYIEENKPFRSAWQSSLYSLLFPLEMVRYLRKLLCVKDCVYINIYELNWQFLEHSSNKVEISIVPIYFQIHFISSPLCNGTKSSTKHPAHWSWHSFDWYMRIPRKLLLCAIDETSASVSLFPFRITF